MMSSWSSLVYPQLVLPQYIFPFKKKIVSYSSFDSVNAPKGKEKILLFMLLSFNEFMKLDATDNLNAPASSISSAILPLRVLVHL